jgi:thioredoxin reductase (NADPH)
LKPSRGAREDSSPIVLATGIVDLAPDLPKLGESIATGRIRLCPVCDGYEVIDRRVAVVGPPEKALKEAEFLLRYTSHVALLANDPADVCETSRRTAAALNIEIHDTVDDLVPTTHGYDAVLDNGRRIPFDVIYPAMGCDVRSELAAALGVHCSSDGYVIVDSHQRTSVDGVYAIGDVADALNQIAVAFGQGAIAATDINKSLSSEVSAGARSAAS